MVDKVKLGLLVKDDTMDSGYQLYSIITITSATDLYLPEFDKLIQCSPFPAKDGRLLFEGDMITFDHSIQTIKAITYCGVIVYEGYKWNVSAKDKMWDGTELGYIYDYFNGNLEYTGSIYLKDGE